MRNHSIKSCPATLEGKIVRLADKIAYINHDIDDSIRGNVITEDDLPKECTEILGHTFRERVNTMILDIVNHSENKNDICMSEEVYRAMFGLRDFMFEHVYTDPDTKKRKEKLSIL